MNLAAMCMTIPPVAAASGPVIGQAYGGGFFVGKIKVGSDVYNLITAPKATGSPSVSYAYKTDTVAFTGATSTNDGILIRNNMIAAGIGNFPAQQFCNNLTIGGFNDWYLPTKDEMELAYRNLKPTTAANVTNSGINPSSVPPSTTNYTATDPAMTTAPLFRTGGSEVFYSGYFGTATAGSGAATFTLKRMTTGADYSESYAFSQLIRAFRRELVV